MAEIPMRDRFRGCLLGLAAGDALGTALEFQPPGTFEPIDDMVGGGLLGLEAGQWTDDTSMALCLGASLLERGAFDALDQMRRYVRWRDDGYMSSTGSCFDIGNTTDAALTRFVVSGEPYAGRQDPHEAGNGSLMRLTPVPMYSPATRPRQSSGAATVRGQRTAPMKRWTRAGTLEDCSLERCTGQTKRNFSRRVTVLPRTCGRAVR